MRHCKFLVLFQGLNRHFLPSLLALLLSGCTTSTLLNNWAPQTSQHDFGRAFKRKPPVKLTFRVGEGVSDRLGSQFYLFLPVGKTTAGEVKPLTFNLLYEELILQGYEPVLTDGPLPGLVPHLDVVLEKLSITTFDLLVTRKVNIDIELRLEELGNPSIILRHQCSDYVQLPFSKQLTQQYRLCLAETVREGFSQFSLDFSRQQP